MSGHEAIPNGVLGTGEAVSSISPEDAPPIGNSVGSGVSLPDRNSGASLSRMKQGDRLVNVDLQRITDVINGRIQSPRLVTIKSVVRQQLTNIRSAQRRGMSIREIAMAITEGGCPIEEPTLRKYLHLLGKEKQQRQKTLKKTKALDRGTAVASQVVPVGLQSERAGTETEAKGKGISTERSLRRARLVSNINAVKQGE